MARTAIVCIHRRMGGNGGMADRDLRSQKLGADAAVDPADTLDSHEEGKKYRY
jgi:hypothetical protein